MAVLALLAQLLFPAQPSLAAGTGEAALASDICHSAVADSGTRNDDGKGAVEQGGHCLFCHLPSPDKLGLSSPVELVRTDAPVLHVLSEPTSAVMAAGLTRHSPISQQGPPAFS